MFKVEKVSLGPLTKIILSDTEKKIILGIIPELGAVISDFIIDKGGKKINIINAGDTYEEVITEGLNQFKGTKLFPFPNRINKGKYSFQNQEYQLPINFPQEGHAIHGLVFNSIFIVKEAFATRNAATCKLELTYEGKENYYPFSYQLNLDFVLTQDQFTCTTEVINTGKKIMPLGDGWHPYFNLDSKVDELILTIPQKGMLAVNDQMIPTGATSTYTNFLKAEKIGSTSLDTCFQVDTSKNIATTSIYSPKNQLTVDVFQESTPGKYNFLQVYTPPDRKSIAVEPMTAAPDCFNNKSGLISLGPNENVKFTFGVKVK